VFARVSSPDATPAVPGAASVLEEQEGGNAMESTAIGYVTARPVLSGKLATILELSRNSSAILVVPTIPSV
jgi:hypothetical protein